MVDYNNEDFIEEDGYYQMTSGFWYDELFDKIFLVCVLSDGNRLIIKSDGTINVSSYLAIAPPSESLKRIHGLPAKEP